MRPRDSGNHSNSSNLRQRIKSGVVIAAGAGLAFALGSPFFTLFCAIAAGLLLYELAGLCAPSTSGNRRIALGIGGFLICFVAESCGSTGVLSALTGGHTATLNSICRSASSFVPGGANANLAILAMVAALAFSFIVPSGRPLFAAFGFVVLLSILFLVHVRNSGNAPLALWLILVVVATDVAGYFGGKTFGGAKLAPTLSPGKTWSGAISGWVSAALVGLVFAYFLETASVWAALAASAASQFGDLAESWLKRRAEVKDSSSIIPGHGGVLDRFDGLVAASAAALVLQSLGAL